MQAMNDDKPTVLIADDEEGVRYGLMTRLTKAGFKVVTAANGQEAIDIAKTQEVDAAVLDVKMPGIDGFAVCEYIRQDLGDADLPVFFLTGAQDGIIRDNLGVLSHTVGANRHLAKPCDTAKLAVMLKEAIAATRGRSPDAPET